MASRKQDKMLDGLSSVIWNSPHQNTQGQKLEKKEKEEHDNIPEVNTKKGSGQKESELTNIVNEAINEDKKEEFNGSSQKESSKGINSKNRNRRVSKNKGQKDVVEEEQVCSFAMPKNRYKSLKHLLISQDMSFKEFANQAIVNEMKKYNNR